MIQDVCMCSGNIPSTSLGFSFASRVTPCKVRRGPANQLSGNGGECNTVTRAHSEKTFLVNYCRSDSTRAEDGEETTPPPPLTAVHIQSLQAWTSACPAHHGSPPLSVPESVGSLVDVGMLLPWPLILTLESLHLGLSVSVCDFLSIFVLTYRTSGQSLDSINICQIFPLWLSLYISNDPAWWHDQLQLGFSH